MVGESQDGELAMSGRVATPAGNWRNRTTWRIAPPIGEHESWGWEQATLEHLLVYMWAGSEGKLG